MKEEFLHYIFRNRLWDKNFMQLSDGRQFEILDVGEYNLDSGPDFFNAKVKIEGDVWVGNIEIHVDSSDWYKHKHQNDSAYSNVILHIVYKHSKPVFINESEEIPVWEIVFPQILFNKYSELKGNEKQIPCEDYFEMADKLKIAIWLEKMGVERLEHKCEVIDKYLELSNNDWEHAFYVSLCRSFGAKVNAFSFEQLAINSPLKLIRKYSDDRIKLEALLFGQSGLLKIAVVDEYVLKLKKEYDYLRKLHGLKPMLVEIWKFSKLRPSNLPQIKIAQLVSVLSQFQGLFSMLIDSPEYQKLRKSVKINVSEYWKTHYVFGKSVVRTNSGFGKISFDTLIINTIAPFVYRYSKNNSDNQGSEIYTKLLGGISPEDNRDTRGWEKLGLKADDAFGSQALIHLKRDYCDKRRCLKCQIGKEIMQHLISL